MQRVLTLGVLAAGIYVTMLTGGCAWLTAPIDPTPMPSLPATPGSNEVPLTSDEVRAILGKPQRYRWTTAAGASGYTQVTAGGRIRTYWDTDAVNGQMRFNDSGFCTRYATVRDEREDCYSVYRVDGNPKLFRIFRQDGTSSGTIMLER